ncbi:MAG: undecaprenyl-diphosphate phosphatase [Acidobacteriota bacterium]|nr:undecaprenyl-diphosphate phosphatase [Acidobacteriota bacterium]MDE3044092.1 undecaprenyl-diphosphate phosphatase [Acidobacteriota bacterium]MDE3222447.1 undecaprenyl-diphosphate phosphatase [Acidobacteriota bacterium]
MSPLTYVQAVIMGLLQGVTELFPISSLGHSVLVPSLFGWHNLVAAQSQPRSFFLAFIVGLHVGTAAGLLVYYRATWFELARGLGDQLRRARERGPRALWRLDDATTNPEYRLLALLVLASVPVGLVGLVFEKKFRVLFAKPLDAAIFLTLNGVILLIGEWLRRGQGRHARRRTLATMRPLGAVVIGSSQILALFAGISRSGVSMVAGLLGRYSHEESARFSFLLATPIILAAGVLKLPDLFGPLGHGVRAQTLVGALFAAIAAYVSVRFLVRYFTTKTLTPFGLYCLGVGAFCVAHFA